MPRRTSALDRRPLLIGVVHLPPLPGAPGGAPTDGRRDPPWLERARRDADVLADAGFGAVIVENFGDAPFFRDRVPPESVAAVAIAARAVRSMLPPEIAVGVNVLRNDARAAVGIAAAAGLDFVRVNVLTGAAVTDQGIVEGRAAEVVRARQSLAPRVRILADVHVKHAVPIAPHPIDEDARDLMERGGADGLIVTGTRTGGAPDLHELARVREALPEALLLAGSGITARVVRDVLELADGVIVGTALKRGGRTTERVDLRRARGFVAASV